MLETIQQTFIDDIYKSTRNLGQYLDRSVPNIDERIDIFVNNRRLCHLDYLKSVYETIVQILGEAFFDAMALEFIDISVQKGGNRHEYGADFPDFLRAHKGLSDLHYVGDVAAVEWAHFQAFLGYDAVPISMNEIGALMAAQTKFGLKLVPGSSLFSNYYNGLEIWNAHQGTEFENIALVKKASNLLCWRDQDDEILFFEVSNLMANFLRSQTLKTDFALAIENVIMGAEQAEIEIFQSQFAQAIGATAFTKQG